MSDGFLFVLTLVTAIACGLVAGFFFAFSTTVMKALTRVPESQGLLAMQTINVVVINPLVMLALFGTAARAPFSWLRRSSSGAIRTRSTCSSAASCTSRASSC